MKLGLEVLLESRLDLLDGARVGLIVNPASIDSRFQHAADLFHQHPSIRLTALFGPQHGIRGETQFTVMPRGPSSAANDLVTAIIAPLVAA